VKKIKYRITWKEKMKTVKGYRFNDIFAIRKEKSWDGNWVIDCTLCGLRAGKRLQYRTDAIQMAEEMMKFPRQFWFAMASEFNMTIPQCHPDPEFRSMGYWVCHRGKSFEEAKSFAQEP